jgi:hypothetical protein
MWRRNSYRNFEVGSTYMKKKASLADLQVRKPTAVTNASSLEVHREESSPAPVDSVTLAHVKKRHTSVYFTPEAFEQLTELGYELRRKPKELHQEAFNLLFAKYGKPQIS